MNRWRKCHRFLCAHYFLRTVTCSSAKSRYEKTGRIGANTGVIFFCYGRNFDMIYDIHKVKLSVFLLLN